MRQADVPTLFALVHAEHDTGLAWRMVARLVEQQETRAQLCFRLWVAKRFWSVRLTESVSRTDRQRGSMNKKSNNPSYQRAHAELVTPALGMGLAPATITDYYPWQQTKARGCGVY